MLPRAAGRYSHPSPLQQKCSSETPARADSSLLRHLSSQHTVQGSVDCGDKVTTGGLSASQHACPMTYFFLIGWPEPPTPPSAWRFLAALLFLGQSSALCLPLRQNGHMNQALRSERSLNLSLREPGQL